MEAATKVFLEVKKLLKLRLFDYFLHARTEVCDQEDWSVFDKFGIKNTCSSTDHLEVSAPTSLIAATKASLISKNSENLDFQAIFLNKNRRSVSKKFGVPVNNLALFHLVQLPIL